MKPAPFAYTRAATLEEALAAAAGAARPVAGTQSLGPMLNLRLARPGAVVDIRRLPELRGTSEDATGATWGAAITHAEVEDGIAPDPTCDGFLRAVARTVAYRAVRNRGTLGGRLCHADPAADWPGALALVGAEAEIAGPAGRRRRLPVAAFMRGSFETALAEGEILAAIRIPRPPAGTRHARHKVVRKTGEFAQAIAGLRTGPDGLRAMLGAVDGPPLLFEGPAAVTAARDAIAMLDRLPAHRRAMLRACLDRAAAEAGGA
jgi:carbon-monoxide dehydrogenase medium subunit